MRSPADRLGRRRPRTPVDDGDWDDWIWPVGLAGASTTGDTPEIDRRWNSIGTLATGPIADVDAAGAVADRRRPVMLDLWIRAGDRWVQPARDPSVRQRRIDGLPIVETSVRAGADDVVVTAWADEGGDGRGRVLVSVENTGDQPVAVAAVVRPFTVLGRGAAHSIRVVDRLIVVDGRPLIALPKRPVDIAVGSTQLGDVHVRLGDTLVEDTAIEAVDGSATLAAVWPLAAHGVEIVTMVDGRSPAEAEPTPLDRVIAGWRAHIGEGASVHLPGWPEHLWNSLLSGLLLRVEESSPPKGSDPDRGRDTVVASALALAGLHRPAAIELDRLLDAVTDGSLGRDHWPEVAGACGRLAGHPGDDVLARHGATVVAVVAELLAHPLAVAARHELLHAVRIAAGERAAADAAEVLSEGRAPALETVARLGIELDREAWSTLTAPSIDGAGVDDLAFRLVLGARGRPAADVVPAVRAAAGGTWRWELGGAGDSPHARAALVVGLRAAAVREGDHALELAPGFDERWLGRSVDVRSLPTTWGTLSYSMRWHGARPALLWELVPVESGDPIEITCPAIDPGFTSTTPAGETLLAAPPGAP